MPKRSQTITIEKHGQRVSITPNSKVRNGVTYKSFLVRATIHKERVTKTASTIEDARRAADAMLAQVKAKGGIIATYTPQQTAVIEAALEVCKRAGGVTLTKAVGDYADAVQHLPSGVSLIEAVRGYVARVSKESLAPIKFSELVEKYIATLDGRSTSHINTIRTRLTRASEFFNCKASDVTSSDVDAWLKSLKVSPITQNHHRTALISLFRFAQRKDYLPVGLSAAEKSETAKEKPKSIDWYSPRDSAFILQNIEPRWRAYIAIGLFAGIRPQEIFNLDWADIKDDHIEVRASGSKVGVRRIVPLLPNLRQWINGHPEKGAIAPVFAGGDASRAQSLSLAMRTTAKQGGFKVIYDGLRHSFITYRVADIQNLPQVALEAGNSPEIIQEHYNGRSTPKEAKTYFSIKPTTEPKNLVYGTFAA